MRFSPRLVLYGSLLGLTFAAHGQHQLSDRNAPVGLEDGLLPDAPRPQGEDDAAEPAKDGGPESGSDRDAVRPDSRPSLPAQSSNRKMRREQAEEQVKEEERQRVARLMAAFNTTRDFNAIPLSPGQKFQLFFRSEVDPWRFALAAGAAGINQAIDAEVEWGQGFRGYAKRYGAAYADSLIYNFLGSAMLPSLLHEDPRYFQKAAGRKTSRFLWAAASPVWCRRDNGVWGPNYAKVGGDLIGSAIGRVYYPPSERTVSYTLLDGFTAIAGSAAGAEIVEFWPDLVQFLRRRHEEGPSRRADRAGRPQRPGR